MKKRLGFLLIVLFALAVALVVFFLRNSFTATTTIIDPNWSDLLALSPGQGGLTILGLVLYSDGNEFILDVVRQDSPTSRAPSLYRIADYTKIWHKNKWVKLKKAPEVGTFVFMAVPYNEGHSNEVTGIYIPLDQENSKLNLDNPDRWPKVYDLLGSLIANSKSIWEKEGFPLVDIQINLTDVIEITGFDRTHKGRITRSKNHVYNLDGEFIGSEDFIPFDEFDLQVEFAGKIYNRTQEEIYLSDLGLEDLDLRFIARDYLFRNSYYYVEDQPDYLFADSWSKGKYEVWREVVPINVDSSS